MKKKKPGRPSTGRSAYLEVRLTPQEKERYEKAADSVGVSLSDWVRINLSACSAPPNNPGPGFGRSQTGGVTE